MIGALATSARADDLGPLASACVGSGCPALTAYPSPFNFGPVPPAWRGFDEAFSGIVLGSFTVPASGGAESEGRLAIGGDFLPARGFSVGISGGGTFVVGPQSGFSNLIVRGTATGTNSPFVGTVATLGTTVTGLVRVGGAASGITFDMGVLSQNVGTTPADLGIGLDATFAALQLKSACWAQQTATGTLVNEINDGNGWVLIGDNTSALQVFNLGPNDLAIPTQELNFRNIPTGATVLINISGASPVVNAARINADVTGSPVVPNAPALFNVLFNLYQATAASIPTEVNGSVLIPNGALDLGGSINGRLLVGGNVIFSGGGQELHNYPFTGSLPACAEPTQTPSQTHTETPTQTPTVTETTTETPTATAVPATDTPVPTATNTPIPTATNTPVPTSTDTPVPTATDTAVPTATDTPLPTATDTAVATATNTVIPTATNTPVPTATDTAAATPTDTSLPTATNTPIATATDTPLPTATNTGVPTATNTAVSTATNTIVSTPTNTAVPTSTNTPVRTSTPTPAQQDDGEPCSNPDQCLSGFCVDGVCCDTACDGPGESCDEPGREGQCVRESVSAPPTSPSGLVLATLILLGLGAVGLRVAKR